ncbi:hypothetical protein HMPREF9997_02051 [Corynebacterium durum F0235]|uniref:Uncharacterized protein n=1 Tax=Corynebacterium durum F0235 TaxID=1035195 RepID=L1MD96_9CORY|nr:hypothetical protein HMPREF9997_02051 [Corynebacterium durum F0235]
MLHSCPGGVHKINTTRSPSNNPSLTPHHAPKHHSHQQFANGTAESVQSFKEQRPLVTCS